MSQTANSLRCHHLPQRHHQRQRLLHCQCRSQHIHHQRQRQRPLYCQCQSQHVHHHRAAYRLLTSCPPGSTITKPSIVDPTAPTPPLPHPVTEATLPCATTAWILPHFHSKRHCTRALLGACRVGNGLWDMGTPRMVPRPLRRPFHSSRLPAILERASCRQPPPATRLPTTMWQATAAPSSLR